MSATQLSHLTRQLCPQYEKGEARTIARMLLESLAWSEAAIYTQTTEELLPTERTRLDEYVHRLLTKHEPVQYILGKATFMGRDFMVQSGVLIPRPETAELVQLMNEEMGSEGCVLDVGTGSGCIAISIALSCPKVHVEAWDISPEALRIAARNAAALGAQVDFRECNLLQTTQREPQYTVIVSNPPYILPAEAAAMRTEVLEHEPHTALFVPPDDPLCYMRALSKLGRQTLLPAGRLYVEINPLLAQKTAAVFAQDGYTGVALLRDEQGKQRFIKAIIS
jgi:release factor glutamine methyltransferase